MTTPALGVALLGLVPSVGALLAAPPFVAAQSVPLMPEQSAAKAKELIQQAIQALGGPAYLGVRDTTCNGRFAIFDRHEDLGGYARFLDYTKLPDKNRTEFYKQRNIIQVRTPAAGWDMDRGGVVDAPADVVEDYNEGLKSDVDNLFRLRLNEEGLAFRYSGGDIVDLKRVDWVEVVDRARRTARIAFDADTHLPMRAVFITRDPKTRERNEETVYFSNYQLVQGVLTPMQVWRERNGRKSLQVYLEECKYNTGLDDSLFTRESLEQRFAELAKGKKKK